jgi:hypothetical protein
MKGVKCILGKRWRNWLEAAAAGQHKLLPCKVFNLTQDEIDSGGLRQYLDFFLKKKLQSYHIISCVAITTLGDWDKMTTARGPFWLLPRHRNSLICSPITATVLWPIILTFWHPSTSSSKPPISPPVGPIAQLNTNRSIGLTRSSVCGWPARVLHFSAGCKSCFLQRAKLDRHIHTNTVSRRLINQRKCYAYRSLQPGPARPFFRSAIREA